MVIHYIQFDKFYQMQYTLGTQRYCNLIKTEKVGMIYTSEKSIRTWIYVTLAKYTGINVMKALTRSV